MANWCIKGDCAIQYTAATFEKYSIRLGQLCCVSNQQSVITFDKYFPQYSSPAASEPYLSQQLTYRIKYGQLNGYNAVCLRLF